MPINKDPIYQQLNKELRNLLFRKGTFAPGDKFITEREIGARYQVSRATANKAIASLVAEGILEFRKGIGTFVRNRDLEYDMNALLSFTGKAIAAGKTPSTQVLCGKRIPVNEVPRELHAPLALTKSSIVYYMKRLRCADKKPVILEERYMVGDFCKELNVEALAGSLYDLLTTVYKLRIIGADQVLRAVAISGGDAKLLNTSEGAAGLCITSVGYVSGKIPLWYEETLYRGDSYEFHHRLGEQKRTDILITQGDTIERNAS